MNIERTFKAVLISPWASLVFVMYIFGEHLLTQSTESLSSIASQIPGTLFVLSMFVFGFVGTSYLVVVFAGVPVHWVLSKLGIRHWSIYLFLGLCIGLLWQFVLLLGSNMPSQLQEVGYLAYAINSVVVSLVFWYIAVNSHNKKKQADA
ncbi:hypothetical protein A3742_20970 [Oleiphilus sp. HI0071]|uniref:hypothetical protein n=1 Tax=unclassified Oleiphilus TaxID=2631174 RepID=UPI0007C21773|nr:MULTISPECIES: hypothetical protein [unclassified Oleiphilus]KZY61707.1 hypothetical protein A3737_05660 [Oleiphilus sp. HI0065]KZY79267.1 hypothetical protein A3742_14515 [Oleiphilus sp. HI0071]KZY92508.1 hypothetical protein A3744_02035 [Oleiphilus sp. HI0073]KZZ60997.1 hypothetical protein A3760_04645 [Oleiphilus sp. HI0122]KZZ82406.1 hypothetical protein A3767_00145 [Oleiphilus sp. HI0133]